MNESDRNRPLYMIGVAAELAGMHPQTLRSYEQKGLVTPQRTRGNTRMYSQADIERLELINELTDEGINLAGVIRILDLQQPGADEQHPGHQADTVGTALAGNAARNSATKTSRKHQQTIGRSSYETR